MSEKADKPNVLYNGKIITVDKNFTIVQAVSIQNGKFLAVGSDEEVKASAGQDAEMIDLKGKTVIPGYIDSHNHMLVMGLEKQKVSLASARSIADVLRIIGDACKAAGPGKWVETTQLGFEPQQLKEGRSPNRWELDTVSSNNPVLHVEHLHFPCANSYALRLANITKDTPQPVGGIIMKDPATGEPTGWLSDVAAERVKALIPKPTHGEKVEVLKSIMKEYNSLGITSVIDTFVPLENLEVYRELRANGELTVRSKIMLPFGPDILGAPLTSEQISLGPKTISRQAGLGDFGDDMLRIDGLKTMLDGGIQGALFHEPYMVIPREQEAPDYRGTLTVPEETLRGLCIRAAQAGWRVGIHCLGDAGIELLLNIWEEVNRQTPIESKHWVLVHGFLPRSEHFERIKKLGVRVACQTAHTYTMGGDMVKWWGWERASRSNPVKEYMRNGVIVGGGSDAHYCEWRPSMLVWIDLTRQSKWAGLLGSDLILTREQSLIHHTINSAYISGDEDKQGSIEPGKLADLAILSDDILTCPVEMIKEIEPLMTMVGGEVVYQRQ